MGETHVDAKLSDEEVKIIITSCLAGTQLAQTFGVNKTTITDIRRGHTWKHIWMELDLEPVQSAKVPSDKKRWDYRIKKSGQIVERVPENEYNPYWPPWTERIEKKFWQTANAMTKTRVRDIEMYIKKRDKSVTYATLSKEYGVSSDVAKSACNKIAQIARRFTYKEFTSVKEAKRNALGA